MTTSGQKPPNPATEYEKLTQYVYQSLHNAEGLKNTRVQHNVHVTGKSGQPHQIDVYWEYKLAGLLHRVAVSCKNYGSTIEVGHVAQFLGVLQDIGDIKGVMITPIGYQQGALRMAEEHGIRLYHLRKPAEGDWSGRVKEIVLRMAFYTLRVSDRRLSFDEDWCMAHGVLGKPGVLSGLSTDIAVLDAAGHRLTDFYEMERTLPFSFTPAEGLSHAVSFPDAYMDIEGVGRTKVKSIAFTYDIARAEERAVVRGNEFATWMLGDAQSDWKVFVDDKGKVTGDLRPGTNEEHHPDS